MKENMRKIFVVFLLLLTVSGLSFGFILSGHFGGGSDRVKYNGFTFRWDYAAELWVTNIDKHSIAFVFLPEDTMSIPIEGDVFTPLRDKLQIDATTDANQTTLEAVAIAQHHMLLALSEFGAFLRSGMTDANEFNLPVITCADATPAVPVIYFTHANETRIRSEGDCIIAEYSEAHDALRVKDRLLYGMFRVIE